MTLHLHHTRQIAAWILAALVLSPLTLALTFGSPREPEPVTSPVTGRLTIAGRPPGDIFICLDAGTAGNHEGFSWMHADGTFRIGNMRWFEGGVEPGHYRAHLYTMAGGPDIPEKYRDPKTSGIELDVAPGWNDFQIDLP